MLQLRAGKQWAVENAAVILTFGIAIAVIVTAVVPGLAELLQFDRPAILGRQWWRLMTGHLSHWNLSHLFWDLLMFCVLGVMIDGGRRWLLSVGGSMAAISAALWVAYPQIETYRGLSGVDTALFVVAVAGIIERTWQHHRRTAWIAAACAAGLLAKLVYETLTGHCLFVDDREAGFVPLVAAHVVGAIVGSSIAAGSCYSAVSRRNVISRTTNCRRLADLSAKWA